MDATTYTTEEKPGWYANAHSVVYVTKAGRPYLMFGPDLEDAPQALHGFDAAENNCEPISEDDLRDTDQLLLDQADEIEANA